MRLRPCLDLLAGIAYLTAMAPSPGRADDTALFANAVAPNVVIVIDNSGSMNQVVWHPAYVPERVYDPTGCPVYAPDHPDYDPRCLPEPLCNLSYAESGFDGGSSDTWRNTDLTFRTRDGRTGISKCGNTRDVWVDPEVQAEGNQTRWPLHYLQWYFSENVEVDHDGDGSTILEEILASANGQTSQCVLAQDPTKPATYSKYRRSRVTAAKGILRQVICETSQLADIRYGLAKFYTNSDPEGGYIRVPVEDYTPAHASLLESRIDELEGEQWTPLGETLYNVYRYFQSRSSGEQALGKDGTTRFPVYDLSTSGSSGSAPPSPLTHDCQLNFVILITDGEPTKDTFESMDFSTFDKQLIGDYNDISFDSADETPPNVFFSPAMDASSCGGPSSCKVGLYLDDIAKFMQENDFQPTSSFPSKQVIDTYTVGFTTSGGANTLLEETARAGNGDFFSSNNPEELAVAISKALADIVVKSKAFTAATVPASRATDGNNFFSTYFNPSTSDPFWQGHLKLFEYNALGEVRDRAGTGQTQGDCALLDPLAPARCRSGPLNLSLEGYWDAANEIPDAAEGSSNARKLYVSKSGVTAGALPPTFTTTEVSATDLGVTSADISSYSGFGNGTSGITTAEQLADALVRYARGCEFGSGSCVDRGDGQKLWDIFHSNPVVVGPPNRGVRSQTYREFVARYKQRKRVIYAGSNGGFVHGFNAGEYGTTAVPDGYDRETSTAGREEFGFMAYPARENLKLLPLNVPRSTYYMDGSATASDVWLYPSGSLGPTSSPDSGSVDRWRTVLLGGMREGGRVVWALDVTNPPDFDSPNGEAGTGGPDYPGYLWEFPCEASACDSWRPYMGQSWSQPVVTRVRATVGSCTDPCPSYDRWVAIFGAGYDPQGDPNLSHDSDSQNVDDATDPAVYDAGSDETHTSRAGRAIFMIDIQSGQVLAAKHFDPLGTAGDASDGEPEMRYAVAAAPAVFDLDRDGYADVVYVPDLGGNLWKWVLDGPARDHINGSQGDTQQADWPFVKIFEAESCSSCSTPHYKSFYFPPTGALVGPNLWIALGSGERNDLDFGQADGPDVPLQTEQKNRFYVFKDVDPFERERPSSDLPYTDASSGSDFVDVTTVSDTNPNTCLAGGAVGFYISGEDGEKFITQSVIFFGAVFTGSYVPPSATASSCDATGSAYVYGFDLFCGEGTFPPSSGNSGDPKERRLAIGSGLPTAPRVSVGPLGGGGGGGGGPCTDMVVVITSEGEAFSDCPNSRPSSGIRLKTWRD